MTLTLTLTLSVKVQTYERTAEVSTVQTGTQKVLSGLDNSGLTQVPRYYADQFTT